MFAMNALHTLFRIVLSCVVFFGLVTSTVRMEINPAKCVATASSVHFTCVTDRSNSGHKQREIAMVEISRNEKPIVFLRECTNITYSKDVLADKFQAGGEIDRKLGHGHLNLTLSYPKSEDAGNYTCVVYDVDDSGLMWKEARSADFVVEKLDENALETELKEMKKNLASLNQQASFTVAFSATNKKTSITASNGKVVILPDLIMRHGQGYDENTGIFTSPREGLYAFHFVVNNSKQGETMIMELKANDKVISKIREYDPNTIDSASMSSVVHLLPGDKVFVVMRSDQDVLREDMHTVFSGYLIHLF